MYDLTFIEIARMNRGREIAKVRSSGTPVSHLRQFKRFSRRKR